ncbi:MAG: methionine--tRNA ligase subunit beta [Phycisphaerae bacterium]
MVEEAASPTPNATPGQPDAAGGASDTIAFGDFAKVKLRVGRVVEAADHPNADKLLLLTVDLGDERRQICAGLVGHYTPEQLLGRNIVVVANLAPRMMRGRESQGMLLAASNADESRIVLLTTDGDVDPGSPVT